MASTQSNTRTTTNRAEIRRWVESKGGCPAHVKGTERGNDPGILRIDFPGYSGVETLAKMSWDDWFKWFDKKRLALVHQPTTRFSKLISRDSVAGGERTRATPRRASGAKRSTTATTKRSTAKRTTKKPTARGTTRSMNGGRAATTGRGAVKRTSTAKRGTAKRTTTRPATKRPAKRTTR